MYYKLKIGQILEYGARTDANGKPHQEDSMYPAIGQADENTRVFVLCDGMGGHDAGEVASDTVCRTMGDAIKKAYEAARYGPDVITDTIEDAYAELDKRDTGAERKMGTTMTCLVLHPGGATMAHMGDSRIYHLRPDAGGEVHVEFVTRDHSLVNELVDLGQITREEACMSRKKNVITRAMQPNTFPRCQADVHHIDDVRAGDYFYMCTDGMIENMDDRQLCFYFSNKEWDDDEKIAKLTTATAHNRDNHTAFVVHITEVDKPDEATQPSEATENCHEGDEGAGATHDTADADKSRRSGCFGALVLAVAAVSRLLS